MTPRALVYGCAIALLVALYVWYIHVRDLVPMYRRMRGRGVGWLVGGGVILLIVLLGIVVEGIIG